MDAKILLDSINPLNGKRLTTFKLFYPRYIHAQFLTHRMFSKNVSSSRAVPVNKMIERITKENSTPERWGLNQKGMQSYEFADASLAEQAKEIWLEAMNNAISSVQKLVAINIHKQWANRLLEPFMMIETLVTATEWDNFFNLRIADDAQPEIKELALLMKKRLDESVPEKREWHLPFITSGEITLSLEDKIKISVARSARVSYFLPDNNEFSSPEKDVILFSHLKEAGHFSPFEHVATISEDDGFIRNFRGWRQYRTFVDGQ